MVTTRQELIGQLRHALNMAESSANSVVEFEIGEVGFSFDFGLSHPTYTEYRVKDRLTEENRKK